MSSTEHVPYSQIRSGDGSWWGKCSCGTNFRGDNLLEFVEAWKEHRQSSE